MLKDQVLMNYKNKTRRDSTIPDIVNSDLNEREGIRKKEIDR